MEITINRKDVGFSYLGCGFCNENKLIYRPIFSKEVREKILLKKNVDEFVLMKEWVLYNGWHIILDTKKGNPFCCKECFKKRLTAKQVKPNPELKTCMGYYSRFVEEINRIEERERLISSLCSWINKNTVNSEHKIEFLKSFRALLEAKIK